MCSITCDLSCWLCTFFKRILPIAWNIQDNLTMTWQENICAVGVYRKIVWSDRPDFWIFKAWATTHFLARPCNKPFSAPDSSLLVLFGLTVCWAHGLSFSKILFEWWRVFSIWIQFTAPNICVKGHRLLLLPAAIPSKPHLFSFIPPQAEI